MESISSTFTNFLILRHHFHRPLWITHGMLQSVNEGLIAHLLHQQGSSVEVSSKLYFQDYIKALSFERLLGLYPLPYTMISLLPPCCKAFSLL